MTQMGTFTREQVACKNSANNIWCIIDTSVYDLTEFADMHPGGGVVLLQIAGTDCTDDFYNLHRHEVIQKYSHLKIGSIANETPSILTQKPGDLSLVPYGEPTWLMPQFRSPYYKNSHYALQKAMRVFVDTYITPEAAEKEKSGEFISDELLKRMYEAGITQTRFGPGKHLHGVEVLGGVVKGEEFDYFHDLIVVQEMARTGYRGFQDGLFCLSLDKALTQLLIDGRKSRGHDHWPYGGHALGQGWGAEESNSTRLFLWQEEALPGHQRSLRWFRRCCYPHYCQEDSRWEPLYH
jgi:predicted heme/steroid binding protein